MQCLNNIWNNFPRWSVIILSIFVFAALAGNFLANDGQYLLTPLIPYSEKFMDAANANYVSPFEKQEITKLYDRHWLGTDDLGRDIFSGIINGAWIAFWVGLLSVSLALLIGIPFGLFAGYYGDEYEIGILEFIILTLVKLFVIYLLIFFGAVWMIPVAIVSVLTLSLLLDFVLDKLLPKRRKWNMPLDSIMTKFLEIFKSIPTLIILMLLLGTIAVPGIVSISLCLGFLMWDRIARYIRAEVLAIKETGFILAQQSLGMSDFKIMIKHCLPKAIPPVMVSIIFLAASTILMEATLSFLGMGLSIDRVSWGSMLNESRKYIGAWWMAIFPGLCLFLVIAALAHESHHWSQKMRSKEK